MNEQQLILKLTSLHKTVALAESCTGGYVSHRLTNVSGASAVFLGGVVSYANQIKKDVLGVSDEILANHGAVSSACAEAMVRGLKKVTRADYCAAVTGIAGPTGGTPAKPVGTVFIATLCDDKFSCEEFHFSVSREEFKVLCANKIFEIFWTRATAK